MTNTVAVISPRSNPPLAKSHAEPNNALCDNGMGVGGMMGRRTEPVPLPWQWAVPFNLGAAPSRPLLVYRIERLHFGLISTIHVLLGGAVE